MEDRVTSRRLYRSRRERMVAGVAGGLAQYFNVDPTLVRLAFVLLALASGPGLIAYIILAIVLPKRPIEEEEPPIAASLDGGREVIAYALVGFGGLLLAGNLGLFRMFDFIAWGNLWPLALIGVGVALLLKHEHD